jgi:hypothetical protein
LGALLLVVGGGIVAWSLREWLFSDRKAGPSNQNAGPSKTSEFEYKNKDIGAYVSRTREGIIVVRGKMHATLASLFHIQT